MHCNKELKDIIRSHIKTSPYVMINAADEVELNERKK